MIKLNQDNLYRLPKELEIPVYDRHKISAGMVHIGVGGFHRAHQAFYTDALFRKSGPSAWGFCGVALLPHDKKIFQVLKAQDGLYTLMIRQSDESLKARIIGSVADILFGPENPQAVIEKMADEAIKLITLTITEGGYNFDSRTSEFLKDTPSIVADLKNPARPKTVFGYLTQALKLRKQKRLPVTIQSCDNIQHNGDIARKMLLSFIVMQEPGLATWVEQNVSFPNSMVDRITPVTKPEDIRDLATIFGIEDGWPVVSEEFHQWIIEDNFKAGRPAWEEVGAQFVKDVRPYEEMKLRILNAGHSLIGLTGVLAGFAYIDQAVRNPEIQNLFSRYVDTEVIPTMKPVPGVDLKAYKATVIHRFANPYIKDTVGRIIGESAAKLPKFVFPTIIENLKKGGHIAKGTLIVAAWFVYLRRQINGGTGDEILDEMRPLLISAVESGMGDFLKIGSLFGELTRYPAWVDTFKKQVSLIESEGIHKTIARVLSSDV